MVLGLDTDSSRWLLVYFPVSWLTQFGHGLVTTVVGPTQPYLAKNTGVDIATINLVWTFGFFGYMIGSLGTSFIFKEYLKKDWAKLVFLSVTICLTGVSGEFRTFSTVTTSFTGNNDHPPLHLKLRCSGHRKTPPNSLSRSFLHCRR